MQTSNNSILTASIPVLLAKLTTPMIFGILSFILFNFTDTYFLAFLGTDHLAAIGFSFPVAFITINIALGLGTATESLVARSLAKKDTKNSSSYFRAGLFIALTSALITFALAIYTTEYFLVLLGAKGLVKELSLKYLKIWTYGLPFLLVSNLLISAIRSSGNTKIPSLCLFLSALLNLYLDKLFIFGTNHITAMGISGAALATVISWALIVMVSIFFLPSSLKSQESSINLDHIKKIVSIAIPSISSNLLSPVATALMTMITARYGNFAVAAIGFSLRIETIAMSIIIALSSVIVPVVSQNQAKEFYNRVYLVFKSINKFCLFWGFLLCIFFFITKSWIADSISPDPRVNQLITTFLVIVPISYAFESITLLYTNFYTALHQPTTGLLLNFARLIGLFCPISIILGPYFGIASILLAKSLSNFITGTVGFYFLRKQLLDNEPLIDFEARKGYQAID